MKSHLLARFSQPPRPEKASARPVETPSKPVAADFDLKATTIVVLFFAVFLAVGLVIYKDYGISWDEIAQMNIGKANYDFIRGYNQDLLTFDDRYYGPAFEVILTFSYRFIDREQTREVFLLRHLLTFLMFYIGTVFFFLLCRKRFKSWKIGLLGSLFLIISPVIFSHSFYNSKDIPLLAAFIIGVYTLVRFLEKRSILNALAHAFACAFLIDIRIPGAILPAITLAILGLEAIDRPNQVFRSRKLAAAGIFLAGLVGFTILMFPLSWRNPVETFMETFRAMSHFQWFGKTFYLGQFYDASNIPWHYQLVYLAITTPVFYLVNFILGSVVAFAGLLQRPFPRYTLEQKQDLIYLMWFVLPLAVITLEKSVVYNGWRHVFFIYPGLLALALVGFSTWVRFLKSRVRWSLANSAAALVILVSVGVPLRFMIINHPLEHLYYNFLAGPNMQVVKSRFEMDYWGLSYRQGLDYILRTDAQDKIRVAVPDRIGQINAMIFPQPSQDRLQFNYQPEDSNYFMAIYKLHPQEYPYPADKQVFTVKVGQANVLVVYKLH